MDEGSCTAPSGKEPWSPFGLSPKAITLIVAPAIACIPILILYGIPALWRALGSLLGTYLRRKTDGRRAQLLDVMADDEKKYIHEGPKEDTAEKGKKDMWEKIEASLMDKLPQDDKADKEWSGIVGFFHPFWCVLPKVAMVCMHMM